MSLDINISISANQLTEKNQLQAQANREANLVGKSEKNSVERALEEARNKELDRRGLKKDKSKTSPTGTLIENAVVRAAANTYALPFYNVKIRRYRNNKWLDASSVVPLDYYYLSEYFQVIGPTDDYKIHPALKLEKPNPGYIRLYSPNTYAGEYGFGFESYYEDDKQGSYEENTAIIDRRRELFFLLPVDANTAVYCYFGAGISGKNNTLIHRYQYYDSPSLLASTSVVSENSGVVYQLECFVMNRYNMKKIEMPEILFECCKRLALVELRQVVKTYYFFGSASNEVAATLNLPDAPYITGPLDTYYHILCNYGFAFYTDDIHDNPVPNMDRSYYMRNYTPAIYTFLKQYNGGLDDIAYAWDYKYIEDNYGQNWPNIGKFIDTHNYTYTKPFRYDVAMDPKEFMRLPNRGLTNLDIYKDAPSIPEHFHDEQFDMMLYSYDWNNPRYCFEQLKSLGFTEENLTID